MAQPRSRPSASRQGLRSRQRARSRQGSRQSFRRLTSRGGDRPATTSFSTRRASSSLNRGSNQEREEPGATSEQTQVGPGEDLCVADDDGDARQEERHELQDRRAIKAETCQAEQLGKLLLENAARPHTAAHQVRERTRKDTQRLLESSSLKQSRPAQSPAYVQRLVRAQETRREFRQAAMSKRNANWSSPEQFVKGFEVVDPVPLIVNDTIRMESNTAPLYIDMLLALSSEDCGLLEDWTAFSAYVFQSFSFISRHWRKLVYDMRTGTLDKNLPIDHYTRVKVSQVLEPQPERAAAFDRAMQQLGFLNNDTKTAPAPSSSPACPEKSRRVGGGGKEGAGGKSPGSGGKHDFMTQLRRVVGEKRKRQEQLAKRKSSGNLLEDIGRRAKAMELDERPSTSYELELNSREHRRKVDAISPDDVYELARRPRVGPCKIVESQTRGSRRYICSFPGCGKAFNLRVTAERHSVKMHQGKFRLANEVLPQDDKMHMYWPAHSPWVPSNSTKVAKERANIGIGQLVDPVQEAKLGEQVYREHYPFRCRHKTWIPDFLSGKMGDSIDEASGRWQACTERFETDKELSMHVSANHTRPERVRRMAPLMEPTPWIEMRGLKCKAPPSALPPALYLSCCSKHWVQFQPNCDECEFLIKRGDPICPIEFFTSAKVHGEMSIAPATNTVVHVSRPNEPNLAQSHLGRVIAVFRDKFGRKYVAYTRFYRSHEQPFAAGMDKVSQVTEKPYRTYVSPLKNVVGMSIVLRCSKTEYTQRIRLQTLPKLPKFQRLVLNNPSTFPLDEAEVVPTDASDGRPRVFFCEEDDRFLDNIGEDLSKNRSSSSSSSSSVDGKNNTRDQNKDQLLHNGRFVPLVRRIKGVMLDY